MVSGLLLYFAAVLRAWAGFPAGPNRSDQALCGRGDMVGVTGFEPATSSSRTPRTSVEDCHLGASRRRWTSADSSRLGFVAVLRCCTADGLPCLHVDR